MSRLIGGEKLRRQLNRLAQQGPAVIQDALKRLTFEVRDEIEKDVARSLEFSGPSTRNFISKFRAQYRTVGDKFTGVIYPAGPKSESLLARHVERYTQTRRDRADLTLDGKIAIPIAPEVRRGARGKVPARLLPARLLVRDARGRARGFVSKSGRLLMMREKGGGVRPAFALQTSTVNPPRVDVHASFGRAVAARAGAAFGKAIAKAMRAAGFR